MESLAELWKPITGYEGYEVSNFGKIRSLDRIVPWRDGLTRRANGKLIQPSQIRGGYFRVCLTNQKREYVHVLVAREFIGPKPSRYDVNHIDGNKANNTIDNLEYVTRGENIRHAFRLGLMKPQVGESSHSAKLTDDKVREIRKRLASGERRRDLVTEFGVSATCINEIARRENWKHVA